MHATILLALMDWVANVLPVVAQAQTRTPERAQWIGAVIAIVLALGAVLASLMTSRRSHRD